MVGLAVGVDVGVKEPDCVEVDEGEMVAVGVDVGVKEPDCVVVDEGETVAVGVEDGGNLHEGKVTSAQSLVVSAQEADEPTQSEEPCTQRAPPEDAVPPQYV